MQLVEILLPDLRSELAIGSAPSLGPEGAFALAARLAAGGARQIVVLASAGEGEHAARAFVLCEPSATVLALDPLEGEPAPCVGDPLGDAPRFVGVLPYEAARGRLEREAWCEPDTRPPPSVVAPEWLRFDAAVVLERGRAPRVVGLAGPARALAARCRGATRDAVAEVAYALRVVEPEAPALHEARVRALVERIHAGELYQANLARRLAVTLTPASPAAALALARDLCAAFPTPFGVALELGSGARVIGSSPELLLDATPDASGRGFARLVSDPIKGTRARGTDAIEDAARAAELEADPKERAELAMIVDVVRNDLARVCRVGSVTVERPPHVVAHSTVFHRVARVAGQAHPDRSRADVLASLWPSGSVTGAPKVRAMEILRELEPVRRGLYTGGFGYATWAGGVRLAMAIRTLVLGPQGDGEYLVGGGIVADSDPGRELAETRWKSAQLDRLGGGALDRAR